MRAEVKKAKKNWWGVVAKWGAGDEATRLRHWERDYHNKDSNWGDSGE